MSERPSVAYCGPIAEAGEPAAGGKEAGNRSIVDRLRDKGVRVRAFPYPRPNRHAPAPIKAASYGAGLGLLLVRLAFASRRWDILHFNGHYRHFIYLEWLFPLLARALGKRRVIHVRAGDMRAQYQGRSGLYRWLFDRILRGSDAVAVQGPEDVGFVNQRRPGLGFYLPNFVASPARDNPRLEAPGEILELVFVGMVTREKGVEVALQAARALHDGGIAVRLAIVGTGEPAYVDALKARYADPFIRWRGAVDHDGIRDAIRGSHVFVFPTAWPGEGHSNALTEAMAEGIVPVCADHGFNRRIVADAGLILPFGASGTDYAEAIATLWNGGSWPRRARKCRERVDELYTADAVIDTLIALYVSL